MTDHNVGFLPIYYDSHPLWRYIHFYHWVGGGEGLWNIPLLAAGVVFSGAAEIFDVPFIISSI